MRGKTDKQTDTPTDGQKHTHIHAHTARQTQTNTYRHYIFLLPSKLAQHPFLSVSLTVAVRPPSFLSPITSGRDSSVGKGVQFPVLPFDSHLPAVGLAFTTASVLSKATQILPCVSHGVSVLLPFNVCGYAFICVLFEVVCISLSLHMSLFRVYICMCVYLCICVGEGLSASFSLLYIFHPLYIHV